MLCCVNFQHNTNEEMCKVLIKDKESLYMPHKYDYLSTLLKANEVIVLHMILNYPIVFFQEAVQCLEDFTENIKKENRKLKKQLLQLIQQTRALNLHRQQLTEQKRQLLQEQEYAKDLKNIRAKQYKLNKSNWRTPSADNINPVQSDTSATRMQEKDSSQKLKYM